MALIAGHASGMLDGRYLGEGSWLGRVSFVAAPAEVGDVGQLRNVCRGVVGVLRQGPMTRFARYVSVSSGRACGGFGVMADDAGGLPGI